MIDLIQTEDLFARPAGCDERNCRESYILRHPDAPMAELWHANGRVYAKIPIPTVLVEDLPALTGYLPSLVEEAHEVMDHTMERE